MMARLQTLQVYSVVEQGDDRLLGFVLSPDGPTGALRRENVGESRSPQLGKKVAFFCRDLRSAEYWTCNVILRIHRQLFLCAVQGSAPVFVWPSLTELGTLLFMRVTLLHLVF